MGLKDRITQRVERLRKRRPFVDHLVRTVEHYGAVKGSLQAGAVTYFAFLSFFPILALAFAVIGYVAGVYPDAQTDLVEAISEVLPGMVSQQEAEGKIAITDLQAAAPGIFTIGLLVMLYSGLGWISAMRDALLVVFERPPDEQPNFVEGQAARPGRPGPAGRGPDPQRRRSRAWSPAWPSRSWTSWSWATGAEPLLWLLALVLGLAANSVLFFAFFKLLARSRRAEAVAVVGRAAGRGRVRAAQAAVTVPARVDQRPAGVPGVRDRADPAGLDQLLLPGRDVRRCLGAHHRRGPRDP